ncbi:MAG TPA: hypothetical protein VK735_11600 [Pseudonocardia sp.]|jgi:hypothetical protein|uniref:hypothetical protein n=1 Tax=Pseudonocardia sp. TaxID=60912 RepID=UPI002BCDCA26|nr:hypothetical protein [Pseudonocardia sp.]HTF48085.1 hypothetical protein [Pseudonocardia sp.]
MRMLLYVGVGVLVIAVVVLVGVWSVRARAAGEKRARDLDTPWSYYSRPNRDGSWSVGVHRVADGQVLEELEPERLTVTATEEDLLEALGRAMTTAARVEARRAQR